MQNKIFEKFKNDITVSSAIKDVYNKKRKNAYVTILCIFILSVCVGLIFKFKLMGWIISMLLSVMFSGCIVLYFKYSKKEFIMGNIQSIEHDYRLETSKGTRGFGLSNVYTTIRRQHQLVIQVVSNEGTTKKISTIVCPPQYERLLRLGDTLLYHPYLNYPATLSNKSKCICVKCGTMQSVDKQICFECKTNLFNNNTQP